MITTDKIIDYNILYENGTKKLVEEVRHYIGRGWTPKGNIIVLPDNYLMQVIVKIETISIATPIRIRTQDE